ncbi:hypothetical protein DL765_011550 [Monosporascus sp. GIB2]|nr:hypothetical protein DL765_011550 [Monosporascus sp. GIB2]
MHRSRPGGGGFRAARVRPGQFGSAHSDLVTEEAKLTDEGTESQVASAFAGVDHFLILVVFVVLLYVGLVVEMLREVTHARAASGDGDAGAGEEYYETKGWHAMDEIALLKAALGRRRKLDCIITTYSTRETAAVFTTLVIWIGYEKERARRKRLKLEEVRKALSDGSAVEDTVANLLGGTKWDAPTEAELCALIQYNVDAIMSDAMALRKAGSSPALSDRGQVLAMRGISMHMDRAEDDDCDDDRMSIDEEAPAYRAPPPPEGSDNAAWFRKFAALQHSPFQELVERETRKALEQRGIWDPMSIDQGNCKVVGVDCIHRDVRNTADPHHLHRRPTTAGEGIVNRIAGEETMTKNIADQVMIEENIADHVMIEEVTSDAMTMRSAGAGYDNERRWRPGLLRGG